MKRRQPKQRDRQTFRLNGMARLASGSANLMRARKDREVRTKLKVKGFKIIECIIIGFGNAGLVSLIGSHILENSAGKFSGLRQP